jgi:hypothetical protein
MIARIIGLVICAAGVAMIWKLGYGNALDVPGYVKYFFIVLGFGIIGGAWGLVRGEWKNVPPKS